jgi:hypothetical protein
LEAFVVAGVLAGCGFASRFPVVLADSSRSTEFRVEAIAAYFTSISTEVTWKHKDMVATVSIPPSALTPGLLDACDQLDGNLNDMPHTMTVPMSLDHADMDEFHNAQAMPDDDDKEAMNNSSSALNCDPVAPSEAKAAHPNASSSDAPTTADNATDVLGKRFVSPKDFILLKVIGMGAFGKVLQVRNKYNQQVLAMKVISKRLLNRRSGYVENIRAERDILTRVKHPFVVQMHCSFQTSDKLFIIMDYLAGGELFLRLGREGIFLERTAAFYLAEIILALNHLHSRNILHRDLVRLFMSNVAEGKEFRIGKD